MQSSYKEMHRGFSPVYIWCTPLQLMQCIIDPCIDALIAHRIKYPSLVEALPYSLLLYRGHGNHKCTPEYNWLSVFANRTAGYGNTTRTNGTNHTALNAWMTCIVIWCLDLNVCKMSHRAMNFSMFVWVLHTNVLLRARDLWQYSMPILSFHYWLSEEEH